MPARAASASTHRSASRWSLSQRCSSAIEGVLAGRARSWVLNCDCPPGRRTKTTSHRGRPVGELGAVVLLDQGEEQVDPGGDAGRRPAVAVAHEDLVGADVDRVVAAASWSDSAQCVVAA